MSSDLNPNLSETNCEWRIEFDRLAKMDNEILSRNKLPALNFFFRQILGQFIDGDSKTGIAFSETIFFLLTPRFGSGQARKGIKKLLERFD